jgi:hypothetical protein
MIEFSPEDREKMAKHGEWLRLLEQRLEAIRQKARTAPDLDRNYPNAIYLGCATTLEAGEFYYLGQSVRPLRRWESHVRRATGCVPFGDTCTWAILLWDVPRKELDAVESYLIGYVYAKWRCVNMNRGKVEEAFDFGFRDGSWGREPKVCAPIDMSKLAWNEVRVYEGGGITGYKQSGELLHRRWGFHLVQHDFEKAVADEVALRATELENGFESRRKELLENEKRLGAEVSDAYFRGWLWGAAIAAVATGAFVYLAVRT